MIRHLPGDVIIISPGTEPYSGCKVVARITNDRGDYEDTFKKLKIEGEPPNQLFILEPTNDSGKYEKKIFEKPPGKFWWILGVVVGHLPRDDVKNGY